MDKNTNECKCRNKSFQTEVNAYHSPEACGLLTTHTQSRHEDWEPWVQTLASSTNPHDRDLLVAKIKVLLTQAREEERREALKNARPLIMEALGEASMCWSEIPTGVFQSDRAIEVGERLLTRLAGDDPQQQS